MSWTFYPWYHIPSIAGILLAVGLTIFASRWLAVNGIRSAVAVILLAALCSFGSIMELASTTIDSKMFWVKVEYPGIVFISLAWFLLLLNYLGYSRYITKRVFYFLTFIPTITILLQWTNSYHHLIYKSVTLSTKYGITTLAMTYGPWFWLFCIYAYILVITGLLLCIHAILNSSKLHRLQLFLYLLYALIPMIVSTIYLARIGPMPFFDFTPLAFIIVAAIWLWGNLRYHFLQLTPKAHHIIIEGIEDGVIVLDDKGRIIELNPASCRMIGCEPKVLLTKSLYDLPGTWSQLSSYLINNEDKIALTIITETPEKVTYEVRIMDIPTLSNKSSGKIILLRDDTERRDLEERLRQLAFYDTLTGLPNRTLFFDRLEQALLRYRRHQTSTIILFIDLDGFKQINDTLGHSAGDELLCQIAQRLEKQSRESDTVARLGGDEFIILLTDLQDTSEWGVYAKRVIDIFTTPFQVQNNSLTITPSIGVAIASIDGDTADVLIHHADQAMYKAKRNGGNTAFNKF
jgi:diguanylate cyclase (GGDEF)-like protein/PAS domain S-box-containing protein